MIEYLNTLRQKPDHEKKRFAFVLSAGITAIIFVFWLSSFGPVTTTSNTGVAQVISPFESVKNNVANIYDTFVTKKGSVNKLFSNEHTIEVESGNTPH